MVEPPRWGSSPRERDPRKPPGSSHRMCPARWTKGLCRSCLPDLGPLASSPLRKKRLLFSRHPDCGVPLQHLRGTGQGKGKFICPRGPASEARGRPSTWQVYGLASPLWSWIYQRPINGRCCDPAPWQLPSEAHPTLDQGTGTPHYASPCGSN